MIITIIILAYVANVFLNRWLNKIAYQQDEIGVHPFLWFLSIPSTLAFLYSIDFQEFNWFTGKNW